MNERLMREKLLFRYGGALERGDFETVASVLAEAEHDPILEQMILELNEAHGAELPAPRPKEMLPMTTVMTLDRQRPLRFSVALVAAAAALILVVGLLSLNGSRGDRRLAPPPQENGSDAAAVQSSSATPTPAPLIAATATPVAVGSNPLLPGEESSFTVMACVTPKLNMVAAVRAQPELNSVEVGRINAGTSIVLTAVQVSEAEPGLVLNGLAERLAGGELPERWFFGLAQVDDAIIQGWVLTDAGMEIVQCPSPVFMPSIVPTSTPFPVLEPVYLTATAIIGEATVLAAGVAESDAAPMVLDPAQPIEPDRPAALVCLTPQPEMAARVRSRPALDATAISLVVRGTAMLVLSATVNGGEIEEPLSTLIDSEALSAWMSQGMDSPLWFFVRAQVDDAVIQGWVLGDESIQVIECPPTPEMLGTVVPTSTPFPVLEPVQLTATAIISEATVVPPDNSGIFMTATAVIGEATVQAAGVLPPTVVPPNVSVSANGAILYTVLDGDTLLYIAARFGVTPEALISANSQIADGQFELGEQIVIPLSALSIEQNAVEAEIASLSATLEALRAQVATPVPVLLCSIYTTDTVTVYSRPATDSHPLQHDPVPAGTELLVRGIVSGAGDGSTWYQVDADIDGNSIRGGFVRADAVREVSSCPMLEGQLVVPTVPPVCIALVREGVNLHERPNEDTRIITELPAATVLRVISREIDGFGVEWYQVEANLSSGTPVQGYLRADTVDSGASAYPCL
jgi:LysM repeat protein